MFDILLPRFGVGHLPWEVGTVALGLDVCHGMLGPWLATSVVVDVAGVIAFKSVTMSDQS